MPQEAPKISVIAPTTGGLIQIHGVKPRPRLRASYAALAGDFRPLKISSDYHRFVAGPLAALELASPAYELSLSGDIDSGRSWELPTLVAHLVATVSDLASLPASWIAAPDSNDDERVEDDVSPPDYVIWATGMVDPDLEPQAGDYAVARKLGLSTNLFGRAEALAGGLTVIVPAGLSEGDRSALEADRARFGFRLYEVANLGELRAALAEAVDHPALAYGPAPLAAASAATRDVAIAPDSTPAAAYARPLQYRGAAPLHDQTLPGAPAPATQGVLRFMPAAIALGIVVLLSVVIAGLNVLIGSGLSNEEAGHLAPASLDPASDIAVIRLGAADREDCIVRIMESRRFEERTVGFESGGFLLEPTPVICGLRIVNLSESRRTVAIGSDFAAFAIRGDNPIFRGLPLEAGESADLIFAQPPDVSQTDLRVSSDEGATGSARIAILPPEGGVQAASEGRATQGTQ